MNIDFEAAERRACRGMRLAAEKTQRKIDPEWVEKAIAAMVGFLKNYPAEAFTVEQVRAAVAAKVQRPTDLRAWGVATRTALARGSIERVGSAPAASSNNSPKSTYRAGKGVA